MERCVIPIAPSRFGPPIPGSERSHARAMTFEFSSTDCSEGMARQASIGPGLSASWSWQRGGYCEHLWKHTPCVLELLAMSTHQGHGSLGPAAQCRTLEGGLIAWG